MDNPEDFDDWCAEGDEPEPEEFDEDSLSLTDRIALDALELAARHAELADDLADQCLALDGSSDIADVVIATFAIEAVRKHRTLAAAALAAGGLGDDEYAHRAFHLPFLGEDPLPSK